MGDFLFDFCWPNIVPVTVFEIQNLKSLALLTPDMCGDDGEIAYFSVRWKNYKPSLVYRTKPWTKTDEQSRNGKWCH